MFLDELPGESFGRFSWRERNVTAAAGAIQPIATRDPNRVILWFGSVTTPMAFSTRPDMAVATSWQTAAGPMNVVRLTWPVDGPMVCQEWFVRFGAGATVTVGELVYTSPVHPRDVLPTAEVEYARSYGNEPAVSSDWHNFHAVASGQPEESGPNPIQRDYESLFGKFWPAGRRS